MTDNEKEFSKKINVDKAKKKTTVSITLIIISLITYIVPLICGEFDFGIVFEGISLIFLLISRNYMIKYDEIKAKKYIICSIISIILILLYDVIILCLSIKDIAYLFLLGYDYFIFQNVLVTYLIILFAINRDLSKADNPIKYKESTDWFYEKYDEKENKGDKNVWR